MKVELDDYIQILHLPSITFLKNDKRNKRLYFQSFSSELNFKRSIETLKFSLRNQTLNLQIKGTAKKLQDIFIGTPINFNFSDKINYSPQIIYWDSNKNLGLFEVISK